MPWGGGNSGTWGSSPWGDGQPAAPAGLTEPKVTGIEVIGNRLLSVTFDLAMKNGTNLKSALNYTISAVTAGTAVNVLEVLSSDTLPYANTVYLRISPFSIGATYQVTVANVFSTAGGTLDLSNNSAKFIGRITKQDFIQGDKPGLYERNPKSIVGAMLTAVSISDDKIGGDQDDDL